MKTEPTFQQVRKIKPTRLSVSGLFPFKDGVSIPYESTLERDLLLYFTYIPAVEEIVSQPVSILFVKNGMTYPYTPDFIISCKYFAMPFIVVCSVWYMKYTFCVFMNIKISACIDNYFAFVISSFVSMMDDHRF